MSARLLYVMDPMCSWCWGFAPVIDALATRAGQSGVTLQLVVGGLRREREVLTEAGRTRILGHWQAVQASTGQAFDVDRGLPAGLIYDTEPACRALVAARQLDPQKAWPLARLIQQAFYCEGRDVSQAAELRRLAARAGLAETRFADAFDGQAAHSATQSDFNWVQDLGISGFPTLLAQRGGMSALLTNGYQPLERLEPLLARWLEHLASA
ncbi:DsbA family protein [Pseudomonas sp. N040]|uniref:DsbA family protein n=1 Tax=Pseudomonas sp. N040 TaxID=2785325 RepID=UPI0018A3206A|nr:DsbA family protein [Pseudomonas sp. N040]MBF7729452.1 DsbA family protein [Pseudomonas sp. N040]MBW7013092.1 DsbA family protein [Pseudomonas sp. N040]